MDLDFATTLPMRDATTNTPAGFEVPAGACDTHFHVFEPGYEHVSNPQYTFPDATLAQYVAMADFLGIDRSVIVQPTYYGEDNSLALWVLDSYQDRGVRAIRLDLFERKNWSIEDLEGYVGAMAARAAERDWHIQFYSPGSVVRDLLPFLSRHSGRFVIDHMGYMKKSDGLGDADFQGLINALGNGNVWIKLTGPYRIAGDEPLSTTEAIGRALVEARSDRLLWGTDWPHLPNGQRDTGELLNLLATWAPDAADRQKILVDSPTELFFAT